MTTIRIKPMAPEQGDHILMEAADYDPERHELLEPTEAEAAALVAAGKWSAPETDGEASAIADGPEPPSRSRRKR